MDLPSYFNDFLKDIRLSDKTEFIDAHKSLRESLEKDADLSPIVIHTFLQGSYKRSTAIKPCDDVCPDVDVVIVTTIPKDTTTPSAAMKKFEPFLNLHYKDQWEYQQRSIKIDNGAVEIDLVITAAPSMEERTLLLSDALKADFSIEDAGSASLYNFAKSLMLSEDEVVRMKAADPWRSEPLFIPDREQKDWSETDPLAQIAWTYNKNANTNKHYVNVVKAIKWWWREKHSGLKYPKGYPLEHIVGQNCPDGIGSVAEGLATTFQNVVDYYSLYREMGTVPNLTDHGVNQNVLHRLSSADFNKFYDVVKAAAQLAGEARAEPQIAKSSRMWRDLLGDPFPCDDIDEGGEVLAASAPAQVKTERFATSPRFA